MKNNVTAPIRLAWRLAAHTMWAMKLRVLIAALIIAAPMCVAVSLHADREVISDTVKAHQVQTYGSFGTMIQRKWASKTALAEHDRAVKDIVGQEAVMTVSSPTGTLMNNYECPECERRILWTPAQDALGKNSQLVSGRWPKHSHQLLVSDHAVANGAQSSGPISLKLGGSQEAEQYNIVGVARTIIGEKPVLYTSVLDERITTRGELPIGGQFTTWFVPEKRLTNSQTEQLGRLGYTIRYRDNVEASKAHWTHPAMPYFALTALASVAVLQVFAFGLGRLRQTLNTIIQNGGSRRFVLLCAAAQGLILAGLGAAIVTVVGAIAVTIAYHTKSLHQYPLGIDLRTIPAGMLVTSSMLVAACALVTSMVPAFGLTQGNVAEQAKTFTARDADKTLATPKLRVWHVVTFVIVCLGWVGLFATAGWEVGTREQAFSTDPGMYLAALTLLSVATTVLCSVVVRLVLCRVREQLYRRRLIDDSVRGSLASSGLLTGLAACGLAVVPAIIMVTCCIMPLVGNPTGVWNYPLTGEARSRGDNIAQQIRNSLNYSESQVFVGSVVDEDAISKSKPDVPPLALYLGTCEIGRGQTFTTAPCSGDRRPWKAVAVLDVDRISEIYALSQAQKEKMRQGGVLQIVSKDSSLTSAGPNQAALVTFERPTGESPNLLVVDQARSLDVVPVRGQPWHAWNRKYDYVMSTSLLAEQGIPLQSAEILVRKRLVLNDTESEQIWRQTKGDSVTGATVERFGTPAWLTLVAFGGPMLFLGVLLAAGSYRLADKLSTMKALGAPFGARLKITLTHCGIASFVAVGTGFLVGAFGGVLCYGAFVYGAQPRLLVVRPIDGNELWLWLLSPAGALAAAVPCTWLWSASRTDGRSAAASSYVVPVLVALAALVVCSLAAAIYQGVPIT